MPSPDVMMPCSTTFPIGSSRRAKLVALDANDTPVASAIYSVGTTGVAAATVDYTPGESSAVLIVTAQAVGTGTVTVTETGSGISIDVGVTATSRVVRIGVEFSDQPQPDAIDDVRIVPSTDDPNVPMGAGA